MAGSPTARIQPSGNRHRRAAFSCGVEPPDHYFLTEVTQDARRRVASCFVLVVADSEVAGFYTLSAASIVLSDLPALARKLPRYPAIPATRMGRLAVDRHHRGRQYGEALLFDAFGRTPKSNIATYAFVMDAKDETAQDFCERDGFIPLSSAGRRLFKPLSEIAALFG